MMASGPGDAARDGDIRAADKLQPAEVVGSAPGSGPRLRGRTFRNWAVYFGVLGLVGTPSYLWTVAYMRANIPPYDQQALYPYTIERVGTTHAYLAQIRPAFRVGDPDNPQRPRQSALMLYENGVLLGPAHTPHHEIISLGNGRYSHWDSGRAIVMFTASDNSNPKTNGRIYRVMDPTTAVGAARK